MPFVWLDSGIDKIVERQAQRLYTPINLVQRANLAPGARYDAVNTLTDLVTPYAQRHTIYRGNDYHIGSEDEYLFHRFIDEAEANDIDNDETGLYFEEGNTRTCLAIWAEASKPIYTKIAGSEEMFVVITALDTNNLPIGSVILNVSNPSPASLQQALAALSIDTFMSPLRTRQALVNYLFPTTATVATERNLAKYVTTGHYYLDHPSNETWLGVPSGVSDSSVLALTVSKYGKGSGQVRHELVSGSITAVRYYTTLTSGTLSGGKWSIQGPIVYQTTDPTQTQITNADVGTEWRVYKTYTPA